MNTLHREHFVREINTANTILAKRLPRRHYMESVNRLDVWVSHDLSEKNLMDRISICDLLHKRNENDPFLKRMVTGDEKWIVYNNVVRKRSWGKRDEPPYRPPRPVFTRRKSCCAFGGIGRESCIMSSSRRTRRSIRIGTAPNSTNWMQRSRKNVRNRPTGRGSSSTRTTPGLTSLCGAGKNCWSWARMSYRTHPIHLMLHLQITTFSGLCKIFLTVRISPL